MKRSLMFTFSMGCLLVSAFGLNGFIPQDPSESPDEESLDVVTIVEAIKSNPALVNQSFYYDAEFRAVGSFAIHDHFAKRSCIGYLVSDGKRLAYRFIRSLPGLGSDNDAFDVPLSNISKVEYKFYRASRGFLDYYPERLSVKFFFDTPITGLVADWKKDDIKFDIWNVSFGERLMEFLEQGGVRAIEKD